MSWSWHGEPVALAAASDAALSGGPDDLYRYAARAVPRLIGRAIPLGTSGVDVDAALFERSFTLFDGRRRYDATMIDLPELARPLLLFVGALPPRGVRLRIVGRTGGQGRAATINRMTEEPTGVICFTPGTVLDTPAGPRRVEDLHEGDKVSTKDDDAQEILWIGSRRMSGARLHAMPELRPVRLRAGAINGDVPQPDLVVSPQHRIVLKGQVARALFGTPEVLVTARDLMDDRGILIDRARQDVTYVHILLPRHQIVWANGVETESFHPASTNLQTITEDQRARLLDIAPGIDGDPHIYGDAARRTLGADEAAILGSESPPRH
ncbi:MAG: Hint domain-containing protein [Paracoccaceae bacterium]|nr:Hint domain-containing protein [Paracoccaceae bacterium]